LIRLSISMPMPMLMLIAMGAVRDERGRLVTTGTADGPVNGPVNGSVGGSVTELVDRAADRVRRVAAIDCGTNSLRMLIADLSLATGKQVDVQRRMEIVRLGQGVDATGRIAPEALTRTLGVLSQYAEAIRQAGAIAVRMVATSASRDASNSADFAAGVVDILGVPPEVITGAQEAALSFAGATAELPGSDLPPPYLVADIGGGSTEFVVGTSAGWRGLAGTAESLSGPFSPPLSRSVDVGSVRLTERHLRSDPPTRAEIAGAIEEIDATLAAVAAAIPATSAQTLVGVAGTVTTVAAMSIGLPNYQPGRIHHTRVPAAQVHEIAMSLLGQTRAERAQIGPMHPGRVDIIGGGALILDRVLSQLGFAQVVASEHDILDAIAWSIVARDG
jgi:exopolyphosphatase / guanosine-5'-triphosphate,3'-diphosphate pyrophosphatase